MLYWISVILMVLKLTGYLTVSWWIVAAPALVAIALTVCILVLAAWAHDPYKGLRR